MIHPNQGRHDCPICDGPCDCKGVASCPCPEGVCCNGCTSCTGPEFVRIPLTSVQGYATVSKDAGPELIEALNRMAELAYKGVKQGTKRGPTG
jgi:hypothetical protein